MGLKSSKHAFHEHMSCDLLVVPPPFFVPPCQIFYVRSWGTSDIGHNSNSDSDFWLEHFRGKTHPEWSIISFEETIRRPVLYC